MKHQSTEEWKVGKVLGVEESKIIAEEKGLCKG
jgi:hypothetical protein